MSKFFTWVLTLFNLQTPVKVAVLVFIFIFVLAMSIPRCHAEPNDPPYIQFSTGSSVVRGVAPVIDISLTEKSPQLQGAFFQESLTIIGSSTFKNEPAPNNYLVRGLFVDGFGRFDAGLGLCWIDNPAPYNGQHLNFNLQLDYRFITLPITLSYIHCSDAGTQLPNYGRDLLTIGWRFH